MKLDVLIKSFNELVRKPNKTQAELQEMERVRLELETAYTEDERPLVNALVEVGLNVTSSWDLVNTKSSYKEAIPILIDHLSKNYHIKNKEGIVRALAVKEAKGVACKAILDEYHKVPKDKSNYRWAIGNTMFVIITEEYVDDVIDIIQDESNGESRNMFVAALGKTKSSKAKEPLQQLLKDKDKTISKEAKRALKRIK